MYALAPISVKSCFDALQYGQYDLLKTAVVMVFNISCGSCTQGFRTCAERTDGILVNDALDLGLCCGHGGGVYGGPEEST